MIVCPRCQHENLDGTVFCSDCGMQFEGIDSIVTHNIETIEELDSTVEEKQTALFQEGLDTWASLHLLDSGQILPLSERIEFTVGRIGEGQPIMPDIDLTPYQAFVKGVSRLHTALKREGKRVLVMDLDSSNGTYLNGKRLKPNTYNTLDHGDIISLGKLKIQVLLRNP